MATTEGLQATEAECAAVADRERVSLADIQANISGYCCFTGRDVAKFMPLALEAGCLTICLLTMKNGFTIVGKSAPADPANFNADLGAKLAYEDAVRQVWPLMGYELKSKLAAQSE